MLESVQTWPSSASELDMIVAAGPLGFSHVEFVAVRAGGVHADGGITSPVYRLQ